MSEGRFDTERDVFSETSASSSQATKRTNRATIYWHLAISPDGSYILTFNGNTLQFKIIEIERKDELSKVKPFQVDKDFPNIENYKTQQFPLFEIALSNLDEHLGEKVIFVAISLIEKNDMLAKDNNKSTNQANQQHGRTIIYRMVEKGLEYEHNLYQVYQEGGIIRFAHSYTKESIQCFLFNANGIFRYTYSGSKYPFSKKDKKQHFFYPKRLEDELTKFYTINPCLERIAKCIFDHYFVIEQYNEGIQSIQLFNLITMEMEQIFQERLDEHLYKTFSSPIFSISRNKFLLMFSRGVDSVLIYYIENSLEIARKDFGSDIKIMFGEFINGDEGLLLIIKKPKKKFPTIVIWDFFSTDQNSIQYHKGDKDFITKENTETKYYNARCPGNLLTIDANGVVLSIFELWSSKEVEIPQAAFHCRLIPPEKKSSIMSEVYANNNTNHVIYRRKVISNISDKPLVNNVEPWVEDYNYKRISAYLDEEETIQLIIGRTTVQIWQGNSENKFLEYIWSNNTKPGGNDEEALLNIEELNVGDRNFCLKVTWTHDGIMESAEIKWPYSDGHVTAVRHACESLAHLHYRKYKFAGYRKHYKFDKIINNISLLIWRFIKKRPDVWKLMDVRYDVMKYIIIGGSAFLVKYILFGEKNLHLHIPRIKRWDNYENYMIVVEEERHEEQSMENMQEREGFIDSLTDLQVAISFCSKDSHVDRYVVIVGYLLEYYTNNAVQNVGWLITVSNAFPDLYKYELLGYYAREIFYKECFMGLEMSYNIDYRDFMPYGIESRNFIAFSPSRKLVQSTSLKRYISSSFSKTPSIIRIVPLYEFTTSVIGQRKLENQKRNQKPFLWKLFNLLFIPRGYLSNNTSKLSPFVQIIRAENDDKIFNNPTMEAAINYRWALTWNYFIQLYVSFILYASCFAVICGFYLSHAEITGYNYFLFFFIIYFYYFGFYFLFVEYKQAEHLEWNDYFQIFNLFDLAAVIVPLIIMTVFVATSFKFSNGFVNVVTNQNIILNISFSILILMLKFILYLRLLSDTAKYIHIILYVTNKIINKTYIFLLFIFLIFFYIFPIMLFINTILKSSTFSLKHNPNLETESSLLSYFWKGEAIGKSKNDTWNFWTIEIETLALFVGIFVITVLQNVLIAFVGDIYSDAAQQSNNASLSFRAQDISEYEALDDVHFFPLTPDPKYIYYIGKPSCFESWKELCEKKSNIKLYSKYEEKIAEIKDVFVEENLKIENSLWDWKDDEFNYL